MVRLAPKYLMLFKTFHCESFSLFSNSIWWVFFLLGFIKLHFVGCNLIPHFLSKAQSLLIWIWRFFFQSSMLLIILKQTQSWADSLISESILSIGTQGLTVDQSILCHLSQLFGSGSMLMSQSNIGFTWYTLRSPWRTVSKVFSKSYINISVLVAFVDGFGPIFDNRHTF